MLGLALAGCAFEAYNGLCPDSEPPLVMESAGGTRVAFTDPAFLRARMAGLLEVTVVGAKGLKGSGSWFAPVPRAYAAISVGGSAGRTPVAPQGDAPVWNAVSTLFVADCARQRLSLRVLHADTGSGDDLLGAGVRGLGDLADGEEREVTVPLTSGAVVTLRLRFEPFAEVAAEAAAARMGPPVVGAPAPGLTASPWRALRDAVVPPSAANDFLGLEPAAFIDNPVADTQAWLLWNAEARTAVVAFRGTEQDRFQDVLTDLDLTPAALDPEGVGVEIGDGEGGGGVAAALLTGLATVAAGLRSADTDLREVAATGVRAAADAAAQQATPWAHSGFLKAYRAVRVEVLQLLDLMVAGEPAAWTIYVTGHSLGGALSTLGALELATRRGWAGGGGGPRIVNYSFGSPRVGNRAFAEAFNAAVPAAWRVVNNNDAVALVPRLVGYAHVGHLVRLTPEGTVQVEYRGDEGTGGLAEGGGVVDIAAAAVEGALRAGVAPEAAEEVTAGVKALVEAEIAAMGSLMDGSAVEEHLVSGAAAAAVLRRRPHPSLPTPQEPLYLANLELAITRHFKAGK